MVLAEAMRLYPPAWAIGRMAKAAFELDGVQIAARIDLHREPVRDAARPALVSRSRALRPGALDAGSPRRAAQVLLFPVWRGLAGLHRRAIRVDGGHSAVAALAQKWKLRLDPGQRVEPLPLITLRTKHGMRMRVEPR